MIGQTSVSVIICAYTQRRWADLVAAVNSAHAQREAKEVVVVIDYEDELFARAQAEWATPEIRVIPNRHQQGLSGGRNTGLESATSELVAFLDDDAVAASDWLELLVSGFTTDDVMGVGGAAVPVWPSGKPPRTLPPELLWVVGCTYRGQPEERAEVRNIIGCSMLFRRSALAAIGGFNVNTGRVGQIPLGGEETEACIKLRQRNADCKIVFEPRSIVHHRVTPDRTTWRYLRRRCFYEGVSKSALSRDLGSKSSLSSERSYTARILPRAVVRELSRGNLASAFAIVLSLGSAVCGYVYGMTHRRISASVVSDSLTATR